MYLRKLIEKDATLMLQWMHDENVVAKLAADFRNMNIDDCRRFISNANLDDKQYIHRAICTDDDTYLGTISLKNICYKNKNAEYAVVLSGKAMGTGAAMFATFEILKIAFVELGLHKVYLCVKGTNIRARRFYDKIGFRQEGVFLQHITEKDGSYDDLIWLAMSENEYRNIVANKMGRA